jgi:two-component system, OmpR family, phosphate regulon sensor histidine kinase PhoR
LTGKIFLKLIGLLFVVLLLALFAIDQLAWRVTNASYLDNLRLGLTEKAKMMANTDLSSMFRDNPEELRKLANSAGVRITLVERGGRVSADSEADPLKMENHLNRPEIKGALDGTDTFRIHQSQTIGTEFLYYALPYEGGALRLGVPLKRIQSEVEAIRRQLLFYTVLAFVPAVLLVAFLARNVSRRLGSIIEYSDQLSKGNFEATLPNTGSDELGLLGAHLIQTGGKLRSMVGELEKEHSELEKLERVRKDFVINVSHELRTPLASITGYAETLLDGALEDRGHNRKFVEIIYSNAQRLANLTADLLTLSRIELGQRKLHLIKCPIYPLLSEAVDSMRPVADKKAIALVLRSLSDQNQAPEAICEPEALIQVVTNLLDNAIKYTGENGRIEVGLRQKSEYLEVYVSDTGIGIPEEELPRLFERFYRVDKARSRELGGTGLGLAIVKHLTKVQGGEISVTSEAGKGSEFKFSLRCQ